MRCDRIEDLLPAYADSALDPRERAEVEVHLASCPACTSLLACLRAADEALAVFPEVDPGTELRGRLVSIAAPRQKFSLFTLLRKPSLQPVLTAASVLGVVASLYLLNPGRRDFEKNVVRTFHRGVGRVEKLYAQAGGITGSIGSFAENLYASLRSSNPLERDKD
ncbi:MAG: zf-HC2 domain-containing protein [Candidatus Aminicenantes bacterium]|nr:zf-HC2 domain-containing protein [Candidatus Aminicenantes bacterium]